MSKRFLRAFAGATLFVATVVSPSAAARLERFVVRGESMSPTLKSGDLVVLDLDAKPQRGDVVGVRFKNRAMPMIKRVVAVAGDRIALRDDVLWVQGEPVRTVGGEPYRVSAQAAFRLRIQAERYGGIVPAGALVLLGDNAAVSFDSKEYGFAYDDQVIGCAVPVVNMGNDR